MLQSFVLRSFVFNAFSSNLYEDKRAFFFVTSAANTKLEEMVNMKDVWIKF